LISISRYQTDETGTIIQPSRKWFKDAKKATEKALSEGSSHEVDESVTNHDQVRMALERLFNDKCAYCGIQIEETGWDVEHFRPKGRVAERKDHPGYYWLSYSWNNLYTSCVTCNRHRRDKPRWGNPNYGIAGGKQTQFPLEDETDRAMTPTSDIKKEKHMLLDPCHDEPECFLTYNINGDIIPVNNNDKGEATIKICNLRRRRLRVRRRTIINRTREFLSLMLGLETQNRRKAYVKKGKYLYKYFLAPNCEFAGAARAVYRDPDVFGINR